MTTRPPRRADETLDALADAFDTVAPHDRAAAEEELLDAGLAPRAVARRSGELAHRASGRAAAPRTPIAAAPTRHWRRWAIAAALLLAVGAALFAGRSRGPERAARNVPAPRDIEPPERVVPSAGVEPGGSEREVARPDTFQRKRSRRPNAAVPHAGGGTEGETDAPVAIEAADLPALVPDSLQRLVRRGALTLHEVAVDPALIAGLQAPDFLAASAANAGHFEVTPSCRLRARGLDLPVRERFGYPFPRASAESPNAACQIVWNAEAAFAAGGGRRGRAAVCGVASSHRERGEEAATQCWDARFTALALVGRPGGPIDNPGEARAASLLRIADLPDAAGVGLASQRPIDGGGDKHWLFIGDKRRVRREADVPVADDRLRLSLDDLDCFSASPDRYEWALRGSREILAPLSGRGIPLYQKVDDLEGGGELLTGMRREAWVVEGTEPNGRRIVLYIDRELYRPYWKIEYEGRDVIATFACAAGWTGAGERVVPLTSSVVRFDARGGRIDRFMPTDETIDPSLRDEHVSLKALTAMVR